MVNNMDKTITEKMVRKEAKAISSLMSSSLVNWFSDSIDYRMKMEKSKREVKYIYSEWRWFEGIDRIFIGMQRVGFSLKGITIQDQLLQHAYNKKNRLMNSVYAADETIPQWRVADRLNDCLDKQMAFCVHVFDDIDCESIIEKVK